VIAVHPRCWGKQQQVFNPLHYLPLLERKPHSFPFARPFENLTLPRCFDVLRGRMESELDHGTREYIGVLRLLETHSVQQLTAAVEKALRRRVYAKDGVAQFLAGCPRWRETTFKLAGRDQLRLVKVSKGDVREYTTLLGHGGAA